MRIAACHFKLGRNAAAQKALHLLLRDFPDETAHCNRARAILKTRSEAERKRKERIDKAFLQRETENLEATLKKVNEELLRARAALKEKDERIQKLIRAEAPPGPSRERPEPTASFLERANRFLDQMSREREGERDSGRYVSSLEKLKSEIDERLKDSVYRLRGSGNRREALYEKARVLGIRAPEGLVLLDRGEVDGVEVGNRFTVYRGGAFVGTVMVIKTYPRLSGGIVLYQKIQLRTGDEAAVKITGKSRVSPRSTESRPRPAAKEIEAYLQELSRLREAEAARERSREEILQESIEKLYQERRFKVEVRLDMVLYERGLLEGLNLDFSSFGLPNAGSEFQSAVVSLLDPLKEKLLTTAFEERGAEICKSLRVEVPNARRKQLLAGAYRSFIADFQPPGDGRGPLEPTMGKALEGVLLQFRPYVFANATKIDFDLEAHVSLFEDGLLKYRKGDRIITLPQISLQRTRGKLQLEGVKSFFITGFRNPFRAEGRAFPGLAEGGKNLGFLFRLRVKR
jgi:hypothetical protein